MWASRFSDAVSQGQRRGWGLRIQIYSKQMVEVDFYHKCLCNYDFTATIPGSLP